MSRPSSAEQRDAGFRDDEEVVMPLPCMDSSSDEELCEADTTGNPAGDVWSAAAPVESADWQTANSTEVADPWLHRALLALDTTPAASLALQPSARFRRLRPAASNVELTAVDGPFATHTTYELPVDTGDPLIDVLHRFQLRERVLQPLNAALVSWSLERERLAKACEERLVHAPPGAGSDASMSKTNVGGYQSYPDVFDDSYVSPKDPDDDTEWFRAARELRRVVNEAMDELGDQVQFDAEDEAHRPDRAAAVPHAAYAWLNVNRSGHSNYLHQHDVHRWSAVYYVHAGEPNAPGFPCPHGGKMVFRAGPHPDQRSAADAGEDGACSHSFMIVTPQPGTLWLFPGSVPHTVLQTVLPPGVPEPETPRISVGINFLVASHPPPRPATVMS